MAKARDERGRFIETEASRAAKAAREATRAAVRRSAELGRKAGREANRVAKGAREAKRQAGGFYTTSKDGKKYFYPAIVEYGAKNKPAQAPMRKSFHAKKDAALEKVITSIREGIRDATKK